MVIPDKSADIKIQMECTDSNVSIDKTSKNKVSAVGANSLYIRKPCTIFFL